MTTIDVLTQYPSTDDLPPIMGAQDDGVLIILENARKRYKRNGTNDAYIESGSKRVFVCAVGAVGAAVGITSKCDDEFLSVFNQVCKQDEAAKTSIDLLNKAARKLYPESKGYRDASWSGPLEWLNQAYTPGNRSPLDFDFKTAKKAVLKCYDYAIERRTSGAW